MFSIAGSNKSSHEASDTVTADNNMSFDIFFILDITLEYYFSSQVVETRLRCAADIHFKNLAVLADCQEVASANVNLKTLNDGR